MDDIRVDILKYYENIENIFTENNLDRSQFCLISDAALATRGLRLNTDIKLARHPETSGFLPESDQISVWENRYGLFGVSDRELLENNDYYDMVSGWKIVRPELEFSFKKFRANERDLTDIELLKKYRQESDDWNPDLDVFDPPRTLSEVLLQTKRFGLSHLLKAIRQYCTTNRFIHMSSEEEESQRFYQNNSIPKFSPLSSTIPFKYKCISDKYEETKYKIKIGDLVNQGATIKYPITNLLQMQYKDSNFQRYDTILFLSVLKGRNDRSELQPKIKNYINNLIESEKKNIEDGVLSVDNDLNVLEPKKFATILQSSSKEIPVEFHRTKQANICDDDWLNSKGVSDKTREIIYDVLYNVLRERGILFKIFIWPPGKEFEQKIKNIINNFSYICNSYIIQLSDDELESLVVDLYSVEGEFKDRTPNMKNIYNKAKCISRGENEVQIYEVRVDEYLSNSDIPEAISQIKREIRLQCHPEVPLGEAYMNPIVHTTDNVIHNKLSDEVVERYTEMDRHSSVSHRW